MQKNFILYIIVLFVVTLLSACDRPEDEVKARALLPWDIEITADGNSRVFDITLAKSKLEDAGKVLSRRYELGLFENQDKQLTLEAYFSEVTLSGLSARLILTLEVPQQRLEELKKKAVKREPLESGAIKYTLDHTDVEASKNLIINSISYIPYVNLNEEMVRRRFGEPAEVIKQKDGKQHFLYPEYGLDVILDEEGKELLQYVAPREFQRLRQPLNNL